MVSVIPNAVVADNFRPLSQDSRDSKHRTAPGPRQPLGPNDVITIVVISRLYYNKGTDLLVASIPRIIAANPNVRFIIAGNGPKAIDLEQMIERNVLQEKVLMMGPVRHEEVRDVMVKGHIYLHPSLMEAFGTVIVEAASCGLYVVCTRVGGIPEVLPTHMTEFAAPEEDDIVAATGRAIAKLRDGKVRTDLFHNQVKQMYSWTDVAQRTERVYDGISGVRRSCWGVECYAWSIGCAELCAHRTPKEVLWLRHMGWQALLLVCHSRLPSLCAIGVIRAKIPDRHLQRLA
jgi:phosphatidylinositol glycan class A protein